MAGALFPGVGLALVSALVVAFGAAVGFAGSVVFMSVGSFGLGPTFPLRRVWKACQEKS
jgi:hypothetical protein